VLLLNECFLLFISLFTKSGNFWIHPHTLVCLFQNSHRWQNWACFPFDWNSPIQPTFFRWRLCTNMGNWETWRTWKSDDRGILTPFPLFCMVQDFFIC